MPEFAEPVATPAAKAERPRPVARVELPRRSFPAPRPATRPVPRPAPGNNQAARPAAATGWKTPHRAEKAGGSRPPFRPTRSLSSADEAGRGAGASRPEKRPDTRGAAPEKRQSAPLGGKSGPKLAPKTNADLRLGREPGRDRVLGHVPLQGAAVTSPTARVRVHRVRPDLAAGCQRSTSGQGTPGYSGRSAAGVQTNRAAWGAKTPANGAQKRKTACALGANWAGIARWVSSCVCRRPR